MVNWYAVGLTVALIYILPKRYIANKIINLHKARSIRAKRKVVIVMMDHVGMNYEKARILAAQGEKIIIASRDGNKAETIKKELIKITKNPNIITLSANSGNRNSMMEFARNIITVENESKIDVIINNEGFDLSNLDLNFKQQELAKERFESHCINFLYDGEGCKDYKLQGWYPTQNSTR